MSNPPQKQIDARFSGARALCIKSNYTTSIHRHRKWLLRRFAASGNQSSDKEDVTYLIKA